MSSPKRPEGTERVPEIERLVAAVAGITDPEDRRQALARSSNILNRATVQRLFDDVAREAHADFEHAVTLSRLAADLADVIDDDVSRALAEKAGGYLHYIKSEHEAALSSFERAADLFAAQGADLDYAATLSTSIHSLSYLGRHDEAYAAAARAREIFEASGAGLRLARLDTNEGNVLFRQERMLEALERYRAAVRGFRENESGPQDVAVGLLNIVTCSIALHEFEQAMATYDELRVHCGEHGLDPVAAQADYNIAYLYFLRGEFERALELYREARKLAHDIGDRYHQALCDLDQAEICLELNLSEEAERLAGSARRVFEELGLSYEASKSVTFLAIAASQAGRAFEAVDLLQKAKEAFDQEGNKAWVAVLDLYQAVIYHDEGRAFQARKLARRAFAFFEPSGLAGKTILCELLLARIALQVNEAEQAAEWIARSLDRLETLDTPALSFRAHLVAGQVAEASGNLEGAASEYRASRDLLESLRAHLRHEELKLAFLRDKQEVYESLVGLAMVEPPSDAQKRSIFSLMEQAKSRILADLISFRATALPSAAPGRSQLVDEMRRLRNELNWYYRQIDFEEIRLASPGERSAADSVAPAATSDARQRLASLQDKSRQHEESLVRTLSELRAADEEFGALQTASTMDLEAIRAAMPENSTILELFEARDVIYGFCVGRTTLEVIPLTTGTLVRDLQRKLEFQLSKFRLGGEYTERFAGSLLESTRSQLRSLHDELIAPLKRHLVSDHLIVVPHGSLHYLPFHALLGDNGYLIDEFSISYAPSANVFALCAAKPAASGSGALVLGVSSELTPGIRDEVEAIAGMIPGARLYLDQEATEKSLSEQGSDARLIHLATHGFFRQDNPMFSAIQLGDTRLTLFDLYRLKLDAELVVLSGCGTGLNVVEGGDELIGLSRGLLYAGARSLVASLWSVHDRSTVDFMREFYRLLSAGKGPALSLQQTMRAVREKYPHPYHWAPFILVGQPGPPT